jgi:hypothetical protein
MSDLLDEVKSMMGPQLTQTLGSKYNLSQEQSQSAIDTIGPLILGGLKRQKDNNGGEERVDHIINKYGNEDSLNDIDSYFNQQDDQMGEPDPGLGGLLGQSGVQAAHMMEQQFKLPEGLGKKLIPMLAPIILGSLIKKSKDTGGGGGSLGGLASMLDRDGDGSILDDVAGMVLKNGGGLLQGATKSGCLGTILSSIIGGKK